jgi:hypothetical protein
MEQFPQLHLKHNGMLFQPEIEMLHFDRQYFLQYQGRYLSGMLYREDSLYYKNYG